MLIATAHAVVCDGMRAIIANYVPSILTAHAVVCDGWQMQKGDWLTQINWIIMIFLYHLRGMFLIHSNRSCPCAIDINRGAVTARVTPHWSEATMWGRPMPPPHNQPRSGCTPLQRGVHWEKNTRENRFRYSASNSDTYSSSKVTLR